jgi:hypothetical protein
MSNRFDQSRCPSAARSICNWHTHVHPSIANTGTTASNSTHTDTNPITSHTNPITSLTCTSTSTCSKHAGTACTNAHAAIRCVRGNAFSSTNFIHYSSISSHSSSSKHSVGSNRSDSRSNRRISRSFQPHSLLLRSAPVALKPSTNTTTAGNPNPTTSSSTAIAGAGDPINQPSARGPRWRCGGRNQQLPCTKVVWIGQPLLQQHCNRSMISAGSSN